MSSRAIRAVLLAAIVSTLGWSLSACGGGDESFGVDETEQDAESDLFFEIPRGAGLALDAGEPLAILPARLEVEVGDVIEIVNDDDRGHLVGPFFVGAGETLRQQFSSPGEFIGECTVHPSGQIVVEVT